MWLPPACPSLARSDRDTVSRREPISRAGYGGLGRGRGGGGGMGGGTRGRGFWEATPIYPRLRLVGLCSVRIPTFESLGSSSSGEALRPWVATWIRGESIPTSQTIWPLPLLAASTPPQPTDLAVIWLFALSLPPHCIPWPPHISFPCCFFLRISEGSGTCVFLELVGLVGFSMI